MKEGETLSSRLGTPPRCGGRPDCSRIAAVATLTPALDLALDGVEQECIRRPFVDKRVLEFVSDHIFFIGLVTPCVWEEGKVG